MAIRLIYTLFLGILVALFVGFGIEAFYPTPDYPEYPLEDGYKSVAQVENVHKSVVQPVPSVSLTPEIQEKELKYQKETREFNKNILPKYNRNVSVITLIAAIGIFIISMVAISKITILSDGLLVGGVLVLLYAMGRSFGVEDSRYPFAAVSVGLITALFLGYIRFIKHEEGRKS